MVSLTFTPAPGNAGPISSSADGHVVGLLEATTYRIDVLGVDVVRFIIDDIELRADATGIRTWAAGFYAGAVAALALDGTGQAHHFHLDICPYPEKLGSDQYSAMLDDIRAFDEALLLGPAAATLGFGAQGRRSRWEPLVQLARLRRHGPAFLAAVSDLTRKPHQFLCATERHLHLRHLRRLHPSALLDRRLAALVSGTGGDAADLELLKLRSSTAAPTMDTAANRALKALLCRFHATVRTLTVIVERGGLGGKAEEQTLRRDRRLEVLQTLSDGASTLLNSSPFAEIARAETSAAGLTQIAAHPRYARAYRLGTQALRVAAGGPDSGDPLSIAPSWGVYETWCFVYVAKLLEQLVEGPLTLTRSKLASADVALAGQLTDGRTVEVLFQAVFPSEKPFARSSAWSISKERRPDIVLAVAEEGEIQRWLVLDAKYRSGRSNVLDAMTSAHVYRDALRLGSRSPDHALLLLPGTTEVASLEASDFWAQHKVGALSEFSMEKCGQARLANFIMEWLCINTSARQ